jgi:hypothetical protein
MTFKCPNCGEKFDSSKGMRNHDDFTKKDPSRLKGKTKYNISYYFMLLQS